MKKSGRLILVFISLAVGIPYTIYNLITLDSLVRSAIDTMVMISITVIAWGLGKQFDKTDFINKQLQQSREKLHEKNREMESLFNNSDAFLWSDDLSNHSITVSRGIEEMCGYERNEFPEIYSTWLNLIHPDDNEKGAIFYQELLLGESSKCVLRIVRRDGLIRWVETRANPVLNFQGEVIKIIGVATDITERILLQEELKFHAYHDSLTRLPNRRYLLDSLHEQITFSKIKGQPLSVLFMDLDGFKCVNDQYGHEFGDLLLNYAAARITNCVRKGDLVSRHGGDEFIILLKNCDKEETICLANRISEKFKKPFNIKNQEILVTTSIGVSLYPRDGESAEALIKKADNAMYYAKQQGKNNVQFHTLNHIKYTLTL